MFHKTPKYNSENLKFYFPLFFMQDCSKYFHSLLSKHKSCVNFINRAIVSLNAERQIEYNFFGYEINAFACVAEAYSIAIEEKANEAKILANIYAELNKEYTIRDTTNVKILLAVIGAGIAAFFAAKPLYHLCNSALQVLPEVTPAIIFATCALAATCASLAAVCKNNPLPAIRGHS
jgi:hypothetical protein